MNPSRHFLQKTSRWLGLCGMFWSAVDGAVEPLESSAFKPASVPGGAALFTKLTAEETGLKVVNGYDDPEMWGSHYKEFMSGSMGTGLAVADYDGDGWPDLFVQSKTSGGRLFRNLGGWRFEDVTEKAGVVEPETGSGSWAGGRAPDAGVKAWREGVVFADVDNDGRPDLYLCRNGYPNLLFMNQGEGRFREEAVKRGLALVDGSGVGAFCDYDRDGWLDVYVQTNLLDATAHPEGQRDHLYHNRGDGTFEEVTGRAGIRGETYGHSVLWADADGDGWPDIYVANDFAVPDQLYHNNHDGTFTDIIHETVPYMSYSSMGSDLGDVNNDGFVDLFVADMATASREKDMRGLASSRSKVLTQPQGRGIAMQFMHNMLLLNTGKGVFQEAAYWAGVASTDWTWSVRFEDFDNDGWLDLHVTNGMAREAANSDVLRRMMQVESDSERIMAMKSGPVLAEKHLAFRNERGLGFTNVSEVWGLGEAGVSFGCVTGDFDRDGDMDLIYVNYQGGLSIFRNDSIGQHRVEVSLRGTQSNRQGVGAVVRVKSALGTQMRPLTVARGYLSGSELVAHFGLGSDTVIDELRVEWPSGRVQTFSQLAVDRAYVVTEAASSISVADKPVELPVMLKARVLPEPPPHASEDVVFKERVQALLPFRADRGGPSVAVGDLNGDGRDDVFVGGTAEASAYLLLQEAGDFRRVEASWKKQTRVEDGPALVLDADGDGVNDLLVSKAGTAAPAGAEDYRPELYLGNGDGSFRAGTLAPSLAVSAGALVAADWDRSGHLGVFLGGRVTPGRYPESPKSFLWSWREGGFQDASDKLPKLGALGLVKSALFTDVDGDGWVDLLLAVEWGNVVYLHNEQGRGFDDWTERAGFASAGKGLWNGLAAADFNGDGKLDYAVGNVGLNTRFGSGEHPVRLYYGNFSGTGTKVIVEAAEDSGKWYPSRTKAELGSQLPAVARKFPRDDLYAKATMADVFGEKAVSGAALFEATEFANGVFLSQPDGRYRFIRLPREAQLAPFQGLVAADFNGDGAVDLCAVQNTRTGMPWFDGGVGALLLGDGHGGFDPVPAVRSGVLVRGEGKALARVAMDGGVGFSLLTTRLEMPVLVLQEAAAGERRLKVTLKGDAGNRYGVGARVMLSFSDGSQKVEEVRAGGGWRSQDSAAVDFTWGVALKPVSLKVTWPDGVESTQAAPFQDRLVVSQGVPK